ncbi:putative tetratricopeptide-like helical domain superfamily [Dioscorea sansibarensis]
MAIIAASCRRHSLLHHLRRLSTVTSSGAAHSPDPQSLPTVSIISVSAAKSRLRREFDPDKALAILSSLPSNPSPSSRFAFDLAVRRLARSGRLSDIQSLLRSRLLNSSSSHEPFLSSLILSYGTGRMLDDALSLFEDLPSLGSSRTVISFNALLSASIKAKLPARVPTFFSDLSEKYSIVPDNISYSILIKSLFLSGNSDKALETLKVMEDKGMEITAITYTTVLDSLYKEGFFEEAEKLWTTMLEKGCVPDLPAYNVKVSYRALHGKPEDVLRLIEEMETAGLKPDIITLNYLMTSYCNANQYEDAKKVYKSMKGKNRRPNAATYKNLLPCLCENGDLDWGLEVFKDSARCHKIPDFQTMRVFVETLVKSSRVEDAKSVISEVRKRFPENLLGNWKALEKELGLDVQGGVSDKLETA